MNRRSFLRLCLGVSATPLVAEESIGFFSWAWSKITSWLSRPKDVQWEPIKVPAFEWTTNPTVSIADIRVRRFYIVDRAQVVAKKEIEDEEDRRVFAAFVPVEVPVCAP